MYRKRLAIAGSRSALASYCLQGSSRPPARAAAAIRRRRLRRQRQRRDDRRRRFRRRHRFGGRRSAAQAFRLPGGSRAAPFYVTISGESNALTGYPFPPDNFSTDSYMPDGWEFQILEYIVVVDKITLWSNPNQSAHRPVAARFAGRAPRRPVRRRPPQGRQDRRPGRVPRAVDAHRRHREPERQRQRPRSTRPTDDLRLGLQHGAGDVRRVQRQSRTTARPPTSPRWCRRGYLGLLPPATWCGRGTTRAIRTRRARRPNAGAGGSRGSCR